MYICMCVCVCGVTPSYAPKSGDCRNWTPKLTGALCTRVYFFFMCVCVDICKS